jgi:hypothetical protein
LYLSTSLSSYLPFSLFFSYRVIRLLPELRKSAEDAAFEEIRGVCSMAEQVLQQYEGGGWVDRTAFGVVRKRNRGK